MSSLIAIQSNSNNDSLVQSFTDKNGNTIPIIIREDGLVNVTALCKAGGKEWKNYIRLQDTSEYIEVLKRSAHAIFCYYKLIESSFIL